MAQALGLDCVQSMVSEFGTIKWFSGCVWRSGGEQGFKFISFY